MGNSDLELVVDTDLALMLNRLTANSDRVPDLRLEYTCSTRGNDRRNKPG